LKQTGKIAQMNNLSRILLIAFSLAACSARTVVPSQTPPDNTATPTVTVIPSTVTPLSTATPDVTSTPIVEPISVPTAFYKDVNVVAKCAAVSQEIQHTNLGNDVAVLEGQSWGADNLTVPGFYLLNMKTGTSINLGRQDEMFSNGSVSPDGTLLFVEAGYAKFLIVLADGKVKKEVQLKEGLGFDAVWQDNRHLMMSIAWPHFDENNNRLTLGKMLWLNPFTGEQRTLVIDFPDLYFNPSSAWSWEKPWGKNPVVYSPSLNRVVYLAGYGTIFELWDIQKKKSLLSWTQFANAEQNIPRWSPDGTKFIMYGILGKVSNMYLPYKLYLVDNDGNLSGLVAGLGIEDYFWSPSGRFVALKIVGEGKDANGYPRDRLLVLDVQTGKITDSCVEFTASESDPALIWSPDETQILLNDKYSESPRHWRVILVDLAKGTAFPIAEDMAATGWMKLP
jgi:hypothetical protein